MRNLHILLNGGHGEDTPGKRWAFEGKTFYEWVDGDRVKLVYSDEDIVYVKKVDFDRAFGAIVSAEKHEIVRDFAIKDGEE